MIENFEIIIRDIETGNLIEAVEAAKKVACKKITKRELIKLANIVQTGVEVHNREAATYAISWIENRTSALTILIDILTNIDNHERVRGQAAEGIGLIRPSKKHKIRKAVEDILLISLKDSSPTVRFWSCYAVGVLEMKNAIRILQELQENDHAVCPGWWYVSEEAEDAISSINNLEWKNRIPVSQRDSAAHIMCDK